MSKKIIFIILGCWMCMMFLFSNQNATKSNHTSDKVTISLIHLVDKFRGKTTGKAQEKKIIKNVRLLVRKTAHMSEYFVLAVLTFCLVSNYVSSNKKVFLITFICCVLFSIGDEIHQLFIPGRTGRIFDVGVDSCGILLGCILLTFIKHKTDKKKLQNI